MGLEVFKTYIFSERMTKVNESRCIEYIRYIYDWLFYPIYIDSYAVPLNFCFIMFLRCYYILSYGFIILLLFYSPYKSILFVCTCFYFHFELFFFS